LPRLPPQQEVSMRVKQDKALSNTYSVGVKGVDLIVFHVVIRVRLLSDLPTRPHQSV
jgi:hypothetical protein